jgi:hypothetical protein
MSRNLSSSVKAQKKLEKQTKSKFGNIQEDFTSTTKNSPMIKLTATITQEDSNYLQEEVLRRSQERGKVLNVSQVLREILQEHKES